MADEHALLSASAADRWSACPASLRLDSAYPESSSKYADEGTAAHTVAAWCLLNDAMPDQYPDPVVVVNDVEWPVTPDMQNHVATYLAVVRSYVGAGSTLLVEQRVDYTDWLFPNGTGAYRAIDPRTGEVSEGSSIAFGTSDGVVLDAVTPPGSDVEIKPGTLVIADLKYGQGVQVYAYSLDAAGKPQVNSQLALYALGCLYEYDHIADIRYVRMIIVQPRLDHVSICDVDVTDLKTFALNMQVSARRAMDVYQSASEPLPEHYAPGEKTCQWCAAKHSCPALTAEIEKETRDLFGALVEHGASAMAAAVPDDRLAQAMAKVPLLEDFCKAVRSETERRLLAGHPVPGFKLVEGRAGPRGWVDDAKAEKDLRRVLGAKDALVMKPISPTQVESQFFKKGLISQRVWDNLNKNVSRSDGKPSVAPASDSRPALRINTTEEVFAQLAASVQALESAGAADDLV